MPAPKSSSAGSRGSSSAGSRGSSSAGSRGSSSAGSRGSSSAGSRGPSSPGPASGEEPGTTPRAGVGDGLATLAEQLVNRVIRPLGLIVLTRERIQEIVDDAAARGRLTRSDANELATELVNKGRQQTDQFLSDLERLLDRGREQLGTATKRARRSEPMGRLIRSADRARRTVGGESFPILGYEELTAAQVQERLRDLTPAELRRVRDYERRHANRKSVLAAIDRALASS